MVRKCSDLQNPSVSKDLIFVRFFSFANKSCLLLLLKMINSNHPSNIGETQFRRVLVDPGNVIDIQSGAEDS